MKSTAIILTFFQAGEKKHAITLKSGVGRVVTIGSQGGQVDVVLPDPTVSRVHAQVLVEGNGLILIDMGSTNGTLHNGRRLPPHTPVQLSEGDEVAFGSARTWKMTVTSAASPAQAPQQSPAQGPQQQVQGVSATSASPGNRHAADKPKGQSLMALLAQKPEITIGRSSECDVVIDSSMASRLHARLRKLPDGRIALIDLGSTNGTFLNGQRIHGNAIVQPGDTIIIGRSVLTLDHAPRGLSGEIAIRTEGIRKDFPNGRVGLQETHFEIAAGRLVAIMGPSGCGKSTLLKCLTGEAPPSRGRVFLHNLELVQNYPFLKTLIGYVPQDDIVHKELTVEQALQYAAHLRMEKPTAVQIEDKIKEVLERLNISHIRRHPIAKISGGQRKRVSIAMELLTDPLVLFLDEPTSPLDPQSIDEFLKILQGLAAKGTTVVMVTHKPEDLDYMDEVIFLAEGGAMVYQGDIRGYKEYFQVRTAVEVYAQISGPKAAAWVQRFRAAHAQPIHAQPSSAHNPRLVKRTGKSMFGELYWLSRRYLRIKTNDLVNLAILIGQAPIIALLVCFIFDKITLSVPFMITLSALWFGTSNAAREIVVETAVYRRERMFTLRIAPYILSKLGVLSLFGGVQAVLFSAIIYIGFQNTDPAWNDFPGTAIWMWFLIVSASLLGLTLSGLVNTVEKAMTLVPLVLIPQVMLAGVVAPMSNGAMEVVSYFSPSRWGNEGMTITQRYVHNTAVDGMEDEVEDPEAAFYIRQEMDSTLTAADALERQYHDSFRPTFGELSYEMPLPLTMLLLQDFILLTILVITMWRKDPI